MRKIVGPITVALLLTTGASAHLVAKLGYGEYRKQFELSTAVIVATVQFLDPNCLDDNFNPHAPPGVTCHTMLKIGHSYKGSFADGSTVEVTFDSENAYDDGSAAGESILAFICGPQEHPVYCSGTAGRANLTKVFALSASGTGVEGLNDDVVAKLPESALPRGELLWGLGDNPHLDALRRAADADTELASRVEIEAILVRAGDSKCMQCLADVKALTEMKYYIGVDPLHIIDALRAAPAGAYLDVLPFLSRETPGCNSCYQELALDMLEKVPVTKHLDIIRRMLDFKESFVPFRAMELVRKAAGDAFGLQPITFDQFADDSVLRQQYVDAAQSWIQSQ